MQTIGKRLRSILDKKEISIQKLSRQIDFSDKMVYNYVNDRNMPSVHFITQLVEKYPDVSAYWLLTGKGNPFVETQGVNQVAIGNGNKQEVKLSDDCLERLAAAAREIDLLKQVIEDKDEIIKLLKGGNNV